MKSLKITPNVNWHTVEPEYGPDSFLKMDNTDVNTKDGVQFNLSYAMKNAVDVKTNNYTQTVLTDNIRPDNAFTPDLNVDKFPEQFTTHLVTNAFPFYRGFSSYLKVIEHEGDENYRWHVMGERTFITEDTLPGYPTWNTSTDVSSIYSDTDNLDDNGIYFTVTFLNERELTIMHDDNYADVYLTMTGSPIDNTERLFFTTRDEITSDAQMRFNYLYNPGSGFLCLFKRFQHPDGSMRLYYLRTDLTKHWKQYQVYNSGETVFYVDRVYRALQTNSQQRPVVGGVMSSYWREADTRVPQLDAAEFNFLEAQPGNFPLPKNSILRTIPYNRNTKNTKIINNWVSYSTHGNQNNLNINDHRSYKNVYNNYMLHLPYKTVTETTASYNTLQLKNQLTPDYNLSRDNPFPNYRACDHREYDRLFTGTNQIGGTDQLSMGYNSYVTTIDLEPDKITYFNTPQEMYPNKKININDCGLIEAGSIGGDTPIVSDKIFKKAADYKYNTPYGAPTEEESGTWLCSWLKTNIGTTWDPRATYKTNVIVNFENKTYKAREDNSDVQPNLDKQTWQEIPGGYPVWVDRYYNPKKFSASQALEVEGQYYDYTSKFEYIVQKFGAENEYVFDKLSDMTLEPGSLYAYYRIGPKENNSIIKTEQQKLIHEGVTPAYKQDRTVHPIINSELSLDGTIFIETQSLNKTKDGQFTVSMNIDCDDWTQPLGSQVVGNYSNHGIGLFNKIATTPYITVTTDEKIYVYNTDMVLLLEIDSFTSYGDAVKAIHAEGSENLHVLCKATGSNDEYTVYQYDMKGMLVEKFAVPVRSSVQIQDINLDQQCYYILYADDTLHKYNINNERRDLLFQYRQWPPQVVGSSTSFSPAAGQSSYTDTSTTYVEPVDTRQYRINCDRYTIDLDGNTWFVKDDGVNVFKNIVSSLEGVASTFKEVLFGRLIDLSSEETIYGATQGNTITFTGDGELTLERLISRWNNSNPGNRVTSLSDSSLDLVIPDNYEIQLTGGVDRGDDLQVHSLSAGSVESIKCDNDNNIWVLTKESEGPVLFKMDTDRKISTTLKIEDVDASLPDLTNVDCNMDLVYEFDETGECHYVQLMMNQQNNTEVSLLKINMDGTHRGTSTVTLPWLATTRLNDTKYQNLTNHVTVNRMFTDSVKGNTLTYKIRYTSYFDTDKTYTEYLNYDLIQLTPGAHHVAFGFNSINSNVALFVDGELQQAETSDDVFTGAAYRFTKTINSPLHVGCDTFFNNVVLSEYLKQQNHNFISNCTVDNIRVYNKYLNFHKIRALTRENKTVENVTLTVPTGKRTYIDQVSQFYQNRTPGRKSNYFDINVVSNTITASDVQQAIEIDVKDKMSDYLPANVYMNNIKWIS